MAGFIEELQQEYPELRGRTVRELADILGYTERQIVRWRAGAVPPTPAQRRMRERIEKWRVTRDTPKRLSTLPESQPATYSGADAESSMGDSPKEKWPMVLTDDEAAVILAWRRKGIAKAREELDDVLKAEAKARGQLQRTSRKK